MTLRIVAGSASRDEGTHDYAAGGIPIATATFVVRATVCAALAVVVIGVATLSGNSTWGGDVRGKAPRHSEMLADLVSAALQLLGTTTVTVVSGRTVVMASASLRSTGDADMQRASNAA